MMMYNDLNIDVIDLPLIGEKRQLALASVGVHTLEDLLYYVPRAYLDRSSVKPIGQLIVGEECTVVGVVQRVRLIPARKRKILKIEIMDNSGILTLNWFHGSEWIQKTFQPGDTVSVFGKVEFYRGNTMTHPDFDLIDPNKDALNTGGVIPVYPLTQDLRKSGFSSRSFRKLFALILDKLHPDLADPLPKSIMQKEGLIMFSDAIHQLHFPESAEKLLKAQYRFKFQESLMLQTIISLKKRQIQEQKNLTKCSKAGNILRDMYEHLPFEATDAQKRVLKEIYADLKSEHSMNRLLQGDVGSGKTLVAAMSAAIVTANGFQTAIMAPTEILANQHYEHFRSEFNRLGVACCLLTGKIGKKQRTLLLNKIASGEIPIVIGTHALIQKDVKFNHLGLTIIDEQHRFGVDQRGMLISKGLHPHVLAMTATPIPRTLSITLYGDMDISIIDEMPKGRIPVKTKVILPVRLPGVYDFFEKEMKAGRQIYVVYPLIAESEKMDLKAAENGYEELKERFMGFNVEMLHGKTKKDDKIEIMRGFINNEINLLVSTTVIEVGVNNPNASVMLVENAERFGLSQLHQLRGRVGRGSDASWCILVQGNNAVQSTERLQVLENSNDGFFISEEDLKQRGQGDIFGARQHGLPDLKFVNMFTDRPIMEKARDLASDLIQQDAQLLLPVNAEFRRYFLAHYSDKLNYSNIG
ncbi:MAG: ATP-dependent DNA helicase RecG [Candidatus Marinimicrobia bacterium]|nr:ATP-dependent DNA helicase RecG [Candidatus Neomarinimicrobiota bacterium]